MKAIWKNAVIAESDATEVVEGNHYFPPDSVNMELLRKSSSTDTICHWKGTASYYDVVVGDQCNQGAVWIYPDPKPEASNIKGYFAFWKGVEIGE